MNIKVSTLKHYNRKEIVLFASLLCKLDARNISFFPDKTTKFWGVRGFTNRMNIKLECSLRYIDISDEVFNNKWLKDGNSNP